MSILAPFALQVVRSKCAHFGMYQQQEVKGGWKLRFGGFTALIKFPAPLSHTFTWRCTLNTPINLLRRDGFTPPSTRGRGAVRAANGLSCSPVGRSNRVNLIYGETSLSVLASNAIKPHSSSIAVFASSSGH